MLAYALFGLQPLPLLKFLSRVQCVARGEQYIPVPVTQDYEIHVDDIVGSGLRERGIRWH